MKYRLTENAKEWGGRTLHQIECVTPFLCIKRGELGGWVEKEDNLSQEGDSWIFDDAKAYGKGKVTGNAKICDNANVCGYAHVYGNSKVSGNAKVGGDVWVHDNAHVYGNAHVHGNASVSGYAEVYGNAEVVGFAIVYDEAKVSGNAKVSGHAWVHGHADVYGDSEISGESCVTGNVKVFGNAKVSGHANLSGNAQIFKTDDYVVCQAIWSSGEYFTYTKSNNMWCMDNFYGTGEELLAKGYDDNQLSGDSYKATMEYVYKLNKIVEESPDRKKAKEIAGKNSVSNDSEQLRNECEKSALDMAKWKDEQVKAAIQSVRSDYMTLDTRSDSAICALDNVMKILKLK